MDRRSLARVMILDVIAFVIVGIVKGVWAAHTFWGTNRVTCTR